MPAFDAARVLDEIERQGVTHMTAVPTLLAALHEERSARPRDVSSLRGILHGGAPIATETLRRAQVAFPAAELLHIYGTTETAPLVTMMPHEERLLDTPQARSCGHSAIGVEVAIVGTDGRSVATGEVGEVAVRGPNVMVGYWNKPAQTADLLVDGWYRSGDLGYQDARGFLYLVDRAKDMIVSGAESLAAVGDGGRFVRAKGAGHNIFDVDPELVQETINDVLNDTN